MKHGLVIFLFLSAFSINAQKGLFIEAGFVDAFNSRTIIVDGEPIANYQSYGYRAGAFYNYPIEKFDIRLGAGVKQLYFSGRHELLNFKGNTTKFTASLTGLYSWNEVLKTGIGLGMENNRDFSSYRAQTSDLFRYNAHILINYKVANSINLTLDYSRTILPYSDFYLLSNPIDQLTLGINYKLPWL